MKAHTQEKAHPLENERGQSLVEMALILPFLFVLVVGVVEAGVALNRQLTVVNAAREGARFGAFGAAPNDIYLQTKEATSQMFQFDDTNAVVAVINATTNEDGTGFLPGTEGWAEKIYPEDATAPHVTQAEVLAELQSGITSTLWITNVGNLKIVVVDVRYDHQSVLGLPFVGAMADEIPIGSWTVMRLASPRVGQIPCLVYPIGIDDDELVGVSEGDDLGKLFERQEGVPGGFGWLRWGSHSSCGSADEMRDCLADPAGCLAGYIPEPSGQCKGGYDNPSNPDDHELNVGDDVHGNSGLAATNLDDVPRKRIRIVVYETANGGGSGAVYYNVKFAIIDVVEVGETEPPQKKVFLHAEFVRMDEQACQ